MNGDEDSPKKVAWGTAALAPPGFDGVIHEARVQKSDKSFGDKEPQDQLFILIRPTSYESPEEKWPRAWYSLSTSRRSKWAALQEALEKCGVLPKESEDELVGKELHWERRDLEFGTNRSTGVKMVAEDVLLPTKFIKDHKKKTTTGAKAPATSSQEQVPIAKVEPPEDVDPEMVVVEMVTKEPMDLEKLYKKASVDFGLRRADTYKAIVGAQKKGLVKLNKEENTLAAIE